MYKLVFMKKEIICIDISNVVPGKGGTGGGISTYAINLIKNLDVILDKNSPTIYCIKNSDFTGLTELKNIIIKNKKVNNSNFVSRLFWLHVRLPFFCLENKIALLHRIVPELPAIRVCKYIITVHDFMFDFYLQNPKLQKYLSGTSLLKFKIFKKLCHMAIGMSNGIIVPAETILNELTDKFHIQNKKVAAIYEASEFPAHELKEKKNDTLNIGVVAGFYPHKGHLQVIKLARNFLDLGFINFKIFMRGSHVYKSYVEDIRKEILKSGLQSFIIFEPFVKDITLEEIYSKFDLVLLLSEYEGFGLPVLEAQSYSVPVACSGIAIFKEILKESAFYINPEFTREYLIMLIQEISSEERLKEKRKEGLNNVKRFSWHKMSYDTLNLYTYFIKKKY